MTVFTGGAGPDSFYGTTGDDTLSGLGGADSLVGGGGHNLVSGGDDNDVITTTWGSDTVDGGAGIDLWNLALGATAKDLTFTYDEATGSGGLTGGTTGSGALSGPTTLSHIEAVNVALGSGNDTVTIRRPLNTPALVSTVAGGAGVDQLTIDNSGSSANSRADIFGDGGSFHGTFSGPSFQNGLAFKDFETLNIKFGDGSDGAFVDATPLASGAKLALDGGGGTDYLSLNFFQIPGTTFDISSGTLVTNVSGLSFTNFEKYSLVLGGGDNYVALGGGDDIISAGAGNDTLDGGGGSDFISKGQGGGLLKGGAGDDQLETVDSSAAPGPNTVDGGSGDDSWSGEYAGSANIAFVYDAASGTGSLTGGTTLSSIEQVFLTTGSGDDSVTVNNAPYNLRGIGFGGGDGFDTLTVNGVDGPVGLLTSIGFSDHGALAGGLDDGSTWFNNYEAVKIVMVSSGEDVQVDAAALMERNHLTIDGGAGDNNLDISFSVGSPDGITFDASHTTLVSSIAGLTALNFKGYSLDLQGLGASNVRGGPGDDVLIGGEGNDTIEGGDGDNSLSGGGGFNTLSYFHAKAGVTIDLSSTNPQDTGGAGIDIINGGFQRLVGSAHADSLTGSANADTILGFGGADSLTAGGGADTLTGGAGADVFRYLQASDSTVAAADLITDFQHGIDKLNLTAVRTGAADTFAISTVGSNTQLDVDLHGDGSIDMRILLVGKSVLTISDLVW